MPRLSKIGDLTTMVLIGFLIDILLGPPHKSWVNRAGSGSEISPRYFFFNCKNFDLFT